MFRQLKNPDMVVFIKRSAFTGSVFVMRLHVKFEKGHSEHVIPE